MAGTARRIGEFLKAAGFWFCALDCLWRCLNFCGRPVVGQEPRIAGARACGRSVAED